MLLERKEATPPYTPNVSEMDCQRALAFLINIMVMLNVEG